MTNSHSLHVTPEQLQAIKERQQTARKVAGRDNRDEKDMSAEARAKLKDAIRKMPDTEPAVMGAGCYQERATDPIPVFVPKVAAGPQKRGKRAPGKAVPYEWMTQRPTKEAKAPRKLKMREAEVLRACMDLLKAHPKVALVWRQNTGSMKLGARFLKFSFPGASDIMGVMVGSGKFIGVECKATGAHLSDDQAAFLGNVSKAGGYALCVDDPAYLAKWLEHI